MLAPTNNPVVPPMETIPNEMESEIKSVDITERIRDVNDKLNK